MNDETIENHESLLQRAIEQYLSDASADTPQRRSALLLQYPQVRSQLEEFFANHDRMRSEVDSAAQDISPAAQAGEIGVDLQQGGASTPRYFGEYELLEELAHGGMGIVFKARHRGLGRLVALKMILGGDFASEAEIRRFQVESQAAAILDHPGIVPIYEVGNIDGKQYFSMAYVEGPTLADRIAAGPLSPGEAAQLMLRVAEAVSYAHQCGVIHRDLKPGNVLLAPRVDVPPSDSAGPTPDPIVSSQLTPLPFAPKITDFGLAKRVEGDSDLTRTGQILGTPSYMPPEQAQGRLDCVNQSADIYAMGAILYACLTGKPPFSAQTPLDTLVQVIHGDVVPPRRIDARIPRMLEAICLKCLQRDPRHRYANAQELADDLRGYLRNEPIKAKPSGVAGRLWRWARSRPALAVAIVGLTVYYGTHMLDYAFFLVDPNPLTTIGITVLVLFWMVGTAVFQSLAVRQGERGCLLYCWAAMDVMLLTAILSVVTNVESPGVVIYFLLVAGAALRFRIGLVWFVCGASIAGYLVLLGQSNWLQPQARIMPSMPFYFVLSLVIIALIMHLLLRRLRQVATSDKSSWN